MSVTPAEADLPNIISVDDHVLEPRDLWQRELPASLRDRGPRTVREHVRLEFAGGKMNLHRDDPDGHWADLWLFDDLVLPTGTLHAAAGVPPEEQENLPAVYEDFRLGTYDRDARLLDMDENHVDVSICYPNTFPRFAGQGFAERADHELGMLSLQIYNDWMIDEWCGGAARGRLIPLTLVPLWDPELAAQEVLRSAGKGSYAIAFSENPAKLGYPSLHSGKWDPLWDACVETDSTVSMHIGSSSSMPTTSADAPLAVSMSLNAQNAEGSLCDWVWSRTLERYPTLKLAYAESQVGWMPFLLERMDTVWHEDVGGVELANAPSSYVQGRVYGCIFDDLHGLRSRDVVGVDTLLFETDYPHANGTWPNSRAVAHRLCSGAAMDADECEKFLRANAIRAYGLERFGVTRVTNSSVSSCAEAGGAADWAAELGLPADVGIVARLVRLDLFVRRVLDDLCGAEGIAVADYLVLAVVRRSPGHRATPSHLCRILDRTSGGMSLALDRLSAAGWLVRSDDPDDGRRVVVELTAAGLELAERGVNDALHEWEAMLELTEAQQRETARVVDRLLDRFATRQSRQSETGLSSPVATS